MTVIFSFCGPCLNDIDLDPLYLCQELLDKIRKEWKVMSVVDVVLNHTANHSPWLWKHPECAYNLENSPHLKPAFLLDRALWHFSCQVADGLWASDGVPSEIDGEDPVQNLGKILP